MAHHVVCSACVAQPHVPLMHAALEDALHQGTCIFAVCALLAVDYHTAAQLFFKQPLVNAAALEASLRAYACNMLPSTLRPLAAGTPLLTADAITAAASVQPHCYRITCILHDALCGRFAASGSSAAVGSQVTADSAAAALSAEQQMPHVLLSLLMTCCKSGCAAAAAAAAGKIGLIGCSRLLCVIDQAVMTADVAMDLAKLYQQQQSNASSSSLHKSINSRSGGWENAAATPWVVLAARCLLLISECYQKKYRDPAKPPGTLQSAAERKMFATVIALIPGHKASYLLGPDGGNGQARLEAFKQAC